MTEAQAERLIAAVERLGALVELALTPDEPPAAPDQCTHPIEQRIDFGVTDGHRDWQCGVPGCGYRSTTSLADGTENATCP